MDKNGFGESSRTNILVEMKNRCDNATRSIAIDMTAGELDDFYSCIADMEKHIANQDIKLGLARRALNKITSNSLEESTIAMCRLAQEELAQG